MIQVLEWQYLAGEGQWESDNVTCSLDVLEYTGVASLNSLLGTDIRQCRPSISSCPDDWEDHTVAAKCAAYALSVRDMDKVTVMFTCRRYLLRQCNA